MARINIELPHIFIYSTEIPIRITDINYGGHLAHDSVLSLTHEARVRFLSGMGFSEGDVDGVGIIISDAAVVYKTEAFYGQTVVSEIAIRDFHQYGCDFIYKLSDKSTGKEIARVKTGIIFFDYKNRKICKVPASFMEKCKEQHI